MSCPSFDNCISFRHLSLHFKIILCRCVWFLNVSCGFLLPTLSLALLIPYVLLCFLPNLSNLSPRTLAKKVLFCHLLPSQRPCDTSASGYISSARITWLTGGSFKGPAVVRLHVQWDGSELVSGMLHSGFWWFQSCLSRYISTVVWVLYRPKNGKAELSRLGVFSSCLCLLAVPPSISAQSAFAAFWSAVQKAARHPIHGGLTVHCVLVVWGRAKLRQRLAFPWQQQLELWAQPALCCPSEMVESAGASSYGVF